MDEKKRLKIRESLSRINEEFVFDNELINYDNWDYVKYYIPKTVKKMTLPVFTVIADLNYFKFYKDLETLELQGLAMLTKRELDYLSKNTNIKNIIVSNAPLAYTQFYKNKCYNDLITLFDGDFNSNTEYYYKNIKIRHNEHEKENEHKLFLVNKIGPKKLDKILDVAQGDAVSVQDFDYNTYTFLVDNRDIYLSVEDKSFGRFYGLYKYLTDSGYNVKSMDFHVRAYTLNEDFHELYNIDFSKLKEIDDNCELTMIFDNKGNATYDEFIGAIEMVKYYRQLITDYNLSPLEKLTFAYDIVKSLKYRVEKEGESPYSSRYPHKIVNSGNIVCAGYMKLLMYILSGLDKDINCSSFRCQCEQFGKITYHRRGFVNIKDPKYNIDGVYVIDPTFDSDKSFGKEVLGDNYVSLDCYNHFLIPLTEYMKYFPKDSFPVIFQNDLSYLNRGFNKLKLMLAIYNAQTENIDNGFKDETIELFPDITMSDADKLKLLDSKNLDIKDFVNLLVVVRLCEGYPRKGLSDVLYIPTTTVYYRLTKK